LINSGAYSSTTTGFQILERQANTQTDKTYGLGNRGTTKLYNLNLG